MKIGKTLEKLASGWRGAEERRSDLYDRLLEVDERLALAGFPKLTKFWRSTLRRFLRSKKKRLVLRVGRRGGKSLTLCKLGVTVALYSETKPTPGELIIIGYISVDRAEAANRTRMNAAMLDALGQLYERRAPTTSTPSRRSRKKKPASSLPRGSRRIKPSSRPATNPRSGSTSSRFGSWPRK
jgi:hypothetical protein